MKLWRVGSATLRCLVGARSASMSTWRLVLALVLAVGCQRLPSLVALSDSGGSEVEPSTRVDRRAAGARTEAADDEGEADEVVVTAQLLPAASATPDGGVATDAAAPPADGGPEPTWPGEYYGSDRFAWRGGDGREMVEVDDRARTRVEADGPKAIVISIVNSATGDVICPLHATTSGNRATIRPRETCFGAPEQAAIVTDGHATLEGDRLVLDFRGHLESTGPSGDDEDEEEDDSGDGEGTYHFEGRRR
jgi:hypothetical protein